MPGRAGRWWGLMGVVASALAGPASHARAEDTPGSEKPAPPKFGAEHLALTKEALLPKGWTLRAEGSPPADAEGTIAAAVKDAAKGAGADPEALTVVARSVAGPNGATATFVLIDADEKTADVAKAVSAAAAKRGWAFRAMAAPSRLLVASAPADARDALVGVQVKWSAQGLAERAQAVLETRDPLGCIAVSRAALQLDPKNAYAHVTLSDPLWGLAQLKQPRASFEPAIKELRGAFAADASYPLPPKVAVAKRGHLAYMLLVEGQSAEARDILLEVVKHGDLAGESHWNNRYNLACAHAKLKEKDAAFAELTAVIERHAKEPVFGIEGWYVDADFENLRDDPRWKALVEKYPDPNADD
jgi:hypothetical protein